MCFVKFEVNIEQTLYATCKNQTVTRHIHCMQSHSVNALLLRNAWSCDRTVITT